MGIRKNFHMQETSVKAGNSQGAFFKQKTPAENFLIYYNSCQ